jgi:hypothetical protein
MKFVPGLRAAAVLGRKDQMVGFSANGLLSTTLFDVSVHPLPRRRRLRIDWTDASVLLSSRNLSFICGVSIPRFSNREVPTVVVPNLPRRTELPPPPLSVSPCDLAAQVRSQRPVARK